MKYYRNDLLNKTHLWVSVLQNYGSTHAKTDIWFGRGTFVCVHSRRIANKMGAFSSSSPSSLSQLNILRYVFSWEIKTELVRSEHMHFISSRTIKPIFLITCCLLTGSFKHSIAILCLLPLATALPICLGVGVGKYDRDLVYTLHEPMKICQIIGINII